MNSIRYCIFRKSLHPPVGSTKPVCRSFLLRPLSNQYHLYHQQPRLVENELFEPEEENDEVVRTNLFDSRNSNPQVSPNKEPLNLDKVIAIAAQKLHEEISKTDGVVDVEVEKGFLPEGLDFEVEIMGAVNAEAFHADRSKQAGFIGIVGEEGGDGVNVGKGQDSRVDYDFGGDNVSFGGSTPLVEVPDGYWEDGKINLVGGGMRSSLNDDDELKVKATPLYSNESAAKKVNVNDDFNDALGDDAADLYRYLKESRQESDTPVPLMNEQACALDGDETAFYENMSLNSSSMDESISRSGIEKIIDELIEKMDEAGVLEKKAFDEIWFTPTKP